MTLPIYKKRHPESEYQRKINFLKMHRADWELRKIELCPECKQLGEDCECVI